jgi:hypothetical protein
MPRALIGLTSLALAALYSSEPKKYLAKLHALTNDWLSKHDYQAGVLWQSAPEVAIRGLQPDAHHGIAGRQPTKPLLELLEQSFFRVKRRCVMKWRSKTAKASLPCCSCSMSRAS